MAERRIETLTDYYAHPWVAGAWLRNMGYEGKLSDKTSLLEGEHDLKDIVSEYLVVSNLDIKRQKATPMRSIKPWMLSGVLRHNPTTEIFRSLWSVDAPGQKNLPIQEREAKTQIISWDVEYYNNMSPGYPFIDQRGVFERIEPSYLVMEKYLNHFGINHMAVMTGRGYHFLTQVPSGSDTMRQLIEIGNKIEKPVAEMQKHVPLFSKRDRPIPPNSELAHQGAGRLMQYLFLLAIDEARRDSGLRVEVSDRGMEGISFDQTPLVRDVGEDKIGTLSYYLKHMVKDEYRAGNTGLLRRVVRNVNGRELDGVARLVQVRQDDKLSAQNLHDSEGLIPNGSSGIAGLICDYKKSDLRKLHLAIDGSIGDPPEMWNSTYRKDHYSWVKESFGNDIYTLIQEANPKLLQPDHLDFFINEVINRSSRTFKEKVGHIKTLLRCIYEDDFNWGKRFTKVSATCHANGWTAIILGQRRDLGSIVPDSDL